MMSPEQFNHLVQLFQQGTGAQAAGGQGKFPTIHTKNMKFCGTLFV